MYVENEDVRDAAEGMAVDELGEHELEQIILRASRMFDLACGVEPEYFEANDADATERTFYGDGSNFLRLDPYVPGSLNTTITFPEGYSDLSFVERDGYLVRTENSFLVSRHVYGGWYVNAPITVSAQWGLEATPDDVKQAVIELTINLWREIDPAHLKLVGVDNQPLRETLPPRVSAIAKKYRVKNGVMV